MTYKQMFPKVVERDREDIKNTVLTMTGDVINARIETLLEDAFLRGFFRGIDNVVEDPQAYDLYYREEI